MKLPISVYYEKKWSNVKVKVNVIKVKKSENSYFQPIIRKVTRTKVIRVMVKVRKAKLKLGVGLS